MQVRHDSCIRCHYLRFTALALNASVMAEPKGSLTKRLARGGSPSQQRLSAFSNETNVTLPTVPALSKGNGLYGAQAESNMLNYDLNAGKMGFWE